VRPGESVRYLSKEDAARHRRAIVDTRFRLASPLSAQRERLLWQIVNCQEWLLKNGTADFEGQLEMIDREIEQRLSRNACEG
jgi:hypothetical protein